MGIICSALSLCESFFSGDSFRVSWPFGLSPALHCDVRRISPGTALCHINDLAGANEKHGKDGKLSMEGRSWASESRCCWLCIWRSYWSTVDTSYFSRMKWLWLQNRIFIVEKQCLEGYINRFFWHGLYCATGLTMVFYYSVSFLTKIDYVIVTMKSLQNTRFPSAQENMLLYLMLSLPSSYDIWRCCILLTLKTMPPDHTISAFKGSNS